jgi:ribonuclease P protein component
MRVVHVAVPVLLPPAHVRAITSSRSSALDLTLPANSRIKKSRDFSFVQGHGRKLFSRSFLIFVAENTNSKDAATRIGITVSKKVDKRAVVRNRIKRLIREFFRQQKSFIRPGIDIVVIAKKNAISLTLAQAEQELVKALRYAGLYEKSLSS